MGSCAGKPLIDRDSITYVPAESDDIPIIFSFAKELIDRYEDVSAISYEMVLKWVLDKITENIENYKSIMLDGIKVGYFHLDTKEHEAELDDLYIVPDYRGNGIGTAVIEYCISQSRKPIFLYVFCKNTGAIQLYRKMGFVTAKTVGNTRMIMRYEG